MELIRITKGVNVGQEVVQTVNARALHTLIHRDPACAKIGYFVGWIQYRLKKFGCVEGKDYAVSVVPSTREKVYHISLNVAKKIAKYDLHFAAAQYFSDNDESPVPDEVPNTVSTAVRFDPPSGVKTMSSVEIVEVINVMRKPGSAELAHDNFMKKVRNHPGISAVNFNGTYFDSQGKERPCYYLPKREAELMVMSESLEVQTKVYDRLVELEEKAVAVFRLPQSYAEALLELAANVQKTEALQLENAAKATQITQQTMLIEHQKPAVEFVEKYVASEGLLTFRAVAKLLAAPEREFRNFLADRGIHYRLQGVWTHAARYGETGTGMFVTKTSVNTTSQLTFARSYFTAKGVEWISKLWNERVPMLTKKPKPVKDIPQFAN